MNDNGATAGTDTVGDALTALLTEQVTAEKAKKTSLETRGLAVITTSGTLVTLLLALGAIITKAHGFQPSLAARIILIVAIGCFILAAALGIYCNAPVGYLDIDPTSLEPLTRPDVWKAPGIEARRRIAEADLQSLTHARRVNNSKALILTLAVIAEVIAALLAAVAASIVLT